MPHCRIDIPRNGDVDQEHRAIHPLLDRTLHVILAYKIMRRAGRDQDDICGGHVLPKLFKRNRRTAESVRQFQRMLRTSGRDSHMANTARNEMLRRQLGHLPRPHQQHCLLA